MDDITKQLERAESKCDKYFSCQNIAYANDILAWIEDNNNNEYFTALFNGDKKEALKEVREVLSCCKK